MFSAPEADAPPGVLPAPGPRWGLRPTDPYYRLAIIGSRYALAMSSAVISFRRLWRIELRPTALLRYHAHTR